MKTMSKRFKTLLGGGFVLLFSLIAIAVGAQVCIQPPPDMTGWWPGDGNTDDIVGDPPRNAVLHGNATTGLSLIADGFILDGDGDFVEVPHDPELNVGAGDFTVDLWVNFNSTAGEQILAEKYVEDFSGNAPGWSFAKLAHNALVVAPNSPQTPPLSLVPGQWYHFAVRRSSGVITIFVNGMPMANGPLGSGGNVDTTSSLKFGHRGSPSDTPGSFDTRGFFLNGRIDEVELFVGRALDDTEILAIFNAGSAGKCKCITPSDNNLGISASTNTAKCCLNPNPKYTSSNPVYRFSASSLQDARSHFKFFDAAGNQLASQTSSDQRGSLKVDKSGLVSCKSKVTVKIVKEIPKWTNVGRLSAPVQAEWKRFLSATEIHEQGHIDLIRSHYNGVLNKIVGKDSATAETILEDIRAKLQAASDKYDIDTQHGKTQGAYLDTTIQ